MIFRVRGIGFRVQDLGSLVFVVRGFRIPGRFGVAGFHEGEGFTARLRSAPAAWMGSGFRLRAAACDHRIGNARHLVRRAI